MAVTVYNTYTLELHQCRHYGLIPRIEQEKRSGILGKLVPSTKIVFSLTDSVV